MEKFAVDLEKVLDEFEFNEEREERVPPSVINNQSSYICHAPPVRPVNYRRPSFEPINLADADFAASPPPPPRYKHNGLSLSDASSTPTTVLQSSSKAYTTTPMIDRQLISTSDFSLQRHSLVISPGDDSLQESWSEEETLSLSEEKPDLLDCDKVKLAENSSITAERVVSNRLPDVTTSINNTPLIHQDDPNPRQHSETAIKPVFDLIDSSTASVHPTIDNDHHCKNINSSININNNINNKVNGFVVDNSLKPVEDNNTSETEISEVKDNVHLKHSEEEKYSSEIVDTASPVVDSTELDQEIGALRYNNNNDNDDISDPSCVEIGFVKEEEEDISQLVNLVDEDFDYSKEESRSSIKEDSQVCLNAEENRSTVDECVSFEGFKETSDNVDKVFDELIEEKKDLIDVHISTPEVKANESNSESFNELETSTESSRDQSEVNEKSETLVGFVALDEACEDEELDKYLEELEILEKEEKANNLIELSKSDAASEKGFAQETLPEDSCSSSESEHGCAAYEGEELKKTPPPKIVRSLSDFIEKEIADNIKERSSNELQGELDKQNALLNYCNSNGQQLSSVEKVSQFAFPVSSVECSLPRRDNAGTSSECKKLNSVSCASGSDSFSDIKPLECQVAVGHSSRQAEISSELASNLSNSLDKASTTAEKSESDVDPITDSEISSDSSSFSESETMGNTAEKVNSSSVVVSETNVSPSSAVIDEGGWSSSSEDVKTDEARLPGHLETAEESDKPSRPNFLELPARITIDNNIVTSPTPSATPSVEESEDGGVSELAGAQGGQREDGEGAAAASAIDEQQLGKVKPFWVPDDKAPNCMHCQLKFSIMKRRHHCRACGKVLCSKCCCMKAKLLFLEGEEARVCQRCYSILEKDGSCDGARSPLGRQPNPNNPMEYCSTIPPLQQVAGSLPQAPPSVLVPVGVLKREGRVKSDVTKQVMFSDGIRPGGDLTELDGSGEPKIPFRRPGRMMKRVGTPPGGSGVRTLRRPMDPVTSSFIPSEGENNLPPTVVKNQGETTYSEFENTAIAPNQPPLKFAINRNLFVHVKRVLLECCVNRDCWCITSEGLACVGQDEIILVLECLPEETIPPKHVFLLINSLYEDASKGNTVSELSFSPAFSNNLLGSKDHGGFLYIRPTYQCTAQLILPNPPYLVALLIHRWETPWARLFPIRLELRLGAEFRYYPCPLVSVRHRPPLYTDIGQTIISLLADFRLYNYTLPVVRGLVVHMEDRQTTILIPRNRYDQVVRALNNSNDSVLPFGANFSLAADSHLVCMQSMEDENTYHTQAINIQNKPRKVTGASFVVFNGALKTTGMTGKSSIVEDGLMVQVSSETMKALRNALRDMHDYTITCGPHGEETVLLKWTVDDSNFNIGVRSVIDGRPLDGVPSMRVHSGIDFSGNLRIIRWTEVFILQSEENSGKAAGDPVDISRLSESLAQATCLALIPFLDLLAAANLTTVALRANIHPDNVGYEAGSNGERLPPLYMKTLDDELVAVVNQAAVAAQDSPAILELVFRVMES